LAGARTEAGHSLVTHLRPDGLRRASLGGYFKGAR